MNNWNENDIESVKSGRLAFDRFLDVYPRFSPAYAMRALVDFCYLGSKDYEAMTRDVENASRMLTPDTNVYGPSDILALRAKIQFEVGHYTQALDDLESAIREKLDNPDSVFGARGTKPEISNNNRCVWTMGNLDVLAQKFPRDYRVPLLRGLYISFFVTYDENLYPEATRELQRAALLNPRSPLPQFFVGALYVKQSFWSKTAWTSKARWNEALWKAIAADTKAIQLDPTFVHAYSMRASSYEQLKEYPNAIADYDKVLELDKDNTIAFADRGLAKLESGQYSAATLDLGEAIKRQVGKGETTNTLWMSYDYRGDAYRKMGMYQDAIENYSNAIKHQLANLTFLITLKQFRGVYPEYVGISDQALVRKLNALFWPQYDYETMSKQLLEPKDFEWAISGINDLYEKRGDAYLGNGDFRHGVSDFQRILKGIPNLAETVDRWRLMGGKQGEEWYLDVKSVEFTEMPRLWIKFMQKDKRVSLQGFQFDCRGHRLAVTSSAFYDKDGEFVSGSNAATEWQHIIPESRGEQMLNGICGGRK